MKNSNQIGFNISMGVECDDDTLPIEFRRFRIQDDHRGEDFVFNRFHVCASGLKTAAVMVILS